MAMFVGTNPQEIEYSLLGSALSRGASRQLATLCPQEEQRSEVTERYVPSGKVSAPPPSPSRYATAETNTAHAVWVPGLPVSGSVACTLKDKVAGMLRNQVTEGYLLGAG
ncbi:MAG TPA: hypothetical protein VGO93_20245 [Candidatus Xenobia bacterium]|jgi:hypothetical protein